MPNFEPIELTKYPIWEQQPMEPDKSFDRFQYFLQLASGNLTECYRRYKEGIGENSANITDASGVWKDECKIYRWRERHKSYWRKIAFDNLAFIEQKKLDLVESELELSQLLINRARDLLARQLTADDRLKDATTLMRTASEISRKALGVDDTLERAILTVTRAGLEVSDPALAEVLGQRGLVGDDGK